LGYCALLKLVTDALVKMAEDKHIITKELVGCLSPYIRGKIKLLSKTNLIEELNLASYYKKNRITSNPSICIPRTLFFMRFSFMSGMAFHLATLKKS
jgi:hypothetical protein